MKLNFTLLAASLATSVSANSYTLCCCTKLTYPIDAPDPRLYDDQRVKAYNVPVKLCNHAATQAVADSMHGHFAFTTHFWTAPRGTPRFKGQDYIYATAINGEDNLIGQKEMTGWCKKQQAGRYCWTPGSDSAYNYKGELKVSVDQGSLHSFLERLLPLFEVRALIIPRTG
ncbi:hypothetical protein Vi05172_g6368 [Venturia inaequalis]|nr:hypothetical protein Vi05172_g6368 [Venturia inaequalis]